MLGLLIFDVHQPDRLRRPAVSPFLAKGARAYLIMALVALLLAALPNFARATESVVRVVVTSGDGGQSGSGFIAADGYVATSRHVVRIDGVAPQATEIFVVEGAGAGRLRPARLVGEAPGPDIAILRVDGLAAPAFTINLNQSAEADRATVDVYGFPRSADVIDPAGDAIAVATRSSGTINRRVSVDWRGTGRNAGMFQHTAPISSGYSGGPVVNACGQVVGLNVGFASRSGGSAPSSGEAYSFAADAAELVRVLRSNGVQPSVSRESCQTPFALSRQFLVPALLLASLSALALAIFFYWRPAAAGVSEHVDPVAATDPTAPPARSRSTPIRHLLEVVLPSRKTRKIELDPGANDERNPIVVGRSPSVAVRVDNNSSVSRKHARLFARRVSNGVRWFIEDLCSLNGTRVNDRTIAPSSPTPIKPGDTIGLGSLNIIFREVGGLIRSRPPQGKAKGHWVLEGTDPQTGTALSLALPDPMVVRAPIIIGRSREFCSHLIDHISISRGGHAQILARGGSYLVKDLNSRFGTSVDGTKLEPDELRPLKLGSILKLGEITLVARQKP